MKTSPRAPKQRALPDQDFTRALVAWFRDNARDLPWRRTRDPYAIWLSEVMLQQTRVETVIPYYERFLRRFPDVAALAAAPLDDVLTLWSGLGYYRRARELHLAAREVTEHRGGTFPAEAAELRALPGVGPYTAGAIASIAFDQPEPLVDGNVARVLSRVSGMQEPIDQATGKKKLWELAARLVPRDAPGAFNQALMELGATVCTPREPACDRCPVDGLCCARATGRVTELPVVTPKRAVPTVRAVALVARDGARTLLGQRVASGLFGGLWEPPTVEARTTRAASAAFGALGLDLDGAQAAGSVRHVLTHRVMAVRVVASKVSERAWNLVPAQPYERFAWVTPARLDDLGLSTLARKVLAAAAPAE